MANVENSLVRTFTPFSKTCYFHSTVRKSVLGKLNGNCTTIHRYPIFSMKYSVMCKVYTGYCDTSEIEHGLCACTVDNPLAKARGLSLRTGAQTMLYLSHVENFLVRTFTYFPKHVTFTPQCRQSVLRNTFMYTSDNNN